MYVPNLVAIHPIADIVRPLSHTANLANKSPCNVMSCSLKQVTFWDSTCLPCGMITEWHLFNVIRRKTLFIHQTSQLWSISNFNILRMHIWQWQQKVYGLYEINSNIAHLQLGWRKIKNKKRNKRVNLHIKKAYRWAVTLMNLLIAQQQKMLSFLNKAFQF